MCVYLLSANSVYREVEEPTPLRRTMTIPDFLNIVHGVEKEMDNTLEVADKIDDPPQHLYGLVDHNDAF